MVWTTGGEGVPSLFGVYITSRGVGLGKRDITGRCVRTVEVL
jgi:hypothetical protein